MERKGIIAAGNMLVDHVHQIGQWPERGWLVEIVHSERATGGAPLNVLLTLAKMHAGLPLQAVGLIGEDNATTSPPCSISTISIASSYSAPAPPPPR